MKYQEELDLSNADPIVKQEYAKLETKIEKWLKDHPKDLTDTEHTELRQMLNKRAELMSKLLNSKVYSIV